jgi:hypothetical protein
MRRLLALVALLPALAACGGHAAKADLPAGQHDLGDNMSVQVHEVRDPVTGHGWDGQHLVAVDLEYFNRGDTTVRMGMAFRVELHDSDGRSGEYVIADGLPWPPTTIPAHSSTRGWFPFTIGADAKPAQLLLWGDEQGVKDPVVVQF